MGKRLSIEEMFAAADGFQSDGSTGYIQVMFCLYARLAGNRAMQGIRLFRRFPAQWCFRGYTDLKAVCGRFSDAEGVNVTL
jgi:hypothetical protein